MSKELYTLCKMDDSAGFLHLGRMTREQARARSGAVPADVVDALRDCAEDAEQHPLYLGDDADSMRIEDVGGDAALITVIAQRCRNALRLLAAAPEPPQGETCVFDSAKVGNIDDAVQVALQRAPNGQAGESTDYAQGWRDACNYIATRRNEPAATPRSGDAKPAAFRVGRNGRWTCYYPYDAEHVEAHRRLGADVQFLYAAPPADARDAEDAKRYRWLLDAAIDRAMKAGG